MSFLKNGYEIVKKAISIEHANCCALEFQLFHDFLNYTNKEILSKNADDGQVKNAFTWYSPFFGEALLIHLKSKIEDITNTKLLPCYSYGRIYYPGCIMNKHKDRPSCEISASLTLETIGESWPIHFTDLNNSDIELKIDPGDMVVYQGTKLYHWREMMKHENTKMQTQVFLHYVNANGPYKNHVYDTRPFLGFSSDFKNSRVLDL